MTLEEWQLRTSKKYSGKEEKMIPRVMFRNRWFNGQDHELDAAIRAKFVKQRIGKDICPNKLNHTLTPNLALSVTCPYFYVEIGTQ